MGWKPYTPPSALPEASKLWHQLQNHSPLCRLYFFMKRKNHGTTDVSAAFGDIHHWKIQKINHDVNIREFE